MNRDKVVEVRERASIVEIVSRYVSLRRTGRNHMGLCPFHGEKTPSFSVSDERGFFHCFGCGASGDVFKFLMRIENVTFPEALERVAKEVGVELPRRADDARRQEGRERFIRATDVAARYFRRALADERVGARARAYLRRRAITDDTARAFGIGYAPETGLVHALEVEKIPLGDAEAIGLVARSQHGPGRYDYFRDRLVFPIVDLGGRTVAFGGRVLADEAQPKYLNSPESELFQKRRSLFALHLAREAIRSSGRVIVVEGNIDAIALWQAEIRNVVATLGTALGADHVRLLRRFTDDVTVLYDGDQAGRRAAARSFEVFAEVGLFANAAILPDGHDPDSFVREHGGEALERLVRDAAPLVDHYLRSLSSPDATLAERQRAGESVADLLSRVHEPVFAGLFAQRAAGWLRIPEDAFRRRGRPRPAVEPARARAEPPPAAPAKPAPALSEAEAKLLEVLIARRDLREPLAPVVEPLLSSDRARDLLARLRSDDDDAGDLLEQLPPASREKVAKALLGDVEIYAEGDKMVAEIATRLERDRLDARLKVVQQAIRDAQSRGDDESVQRLLAEKIGLQASLPKA